MEACKLVNIIFMAILLALLHIPEKCEAQKVLDCGNGHDRISRAARASGNNPKRANLRQITPALGPGGSSPAIQGGSPAGSFPAIQGGLPAGKPPAQRPGPPSPAGAFKPPAQRPGPPSFAGNPPAPLGGSPSPGVKRQILPTPFQQTSVQRGGIPSPLNPAQRSG